MGIWGRSRFFRKVSDGTQRTRSYDLFDPINVGFVSQGKKAERVGFLYDTRVPGNDNQGHLYGTDLPEDQKRLLYFPSP
jgi:hypothetical protein